MQKIKYYLLIVSAVLFCLCATQQAAFAQSDDPSLVWVGKQTATKVQKVTQAKKPYHKKYVPPPKKQKPRPVIVQAPLLSLRWYLRTQGEDGKAKDLHPDHVFKLGDKAQLVVETNQNGYLYIIQEDDLSMVFPFPSFNNGKNDVKKNQPIVIPSNCPAKNTDKLGNCYFDITDSGSALTLIFSRDEIKGLPSEIDPSKGVVPISREDLKKIRGDIKQDYRRKDIKGTEVVQFWNNNPNENEDLIIDTKIKYEKPKE